MSLYRLSQPPIDITGVLLARVVQIGEALEDGDEPFARSLVSDLEADLRAEQEPQP